MGTMTYNSSTRIDFDDRVLVHVQLVIGAKLRRGESFYFNWRDEVGGGEGRTTVWLHPAIPLVFTYTDREMSKVSRAWIEALSVSANSAGGLHIVPEPLPAN